MRSKHLVDEETVALKAADPLLLRSDGGPGRVAMPNGDHDCGSHRREDERCDEPGRHLRQRRDEHRRHHDGPDRETGEDQTHRLSALRRISTNRQTSSNRLYSGTGATRITSGSRQSQVTPEASSLSRTLRPEPLAFTRSESWHPRRFGSLGVRISIASPTSWPSSHSR